MNPLTLRVMAVLFISSLVRSTLGFGDALLAMPLLAMLIGVRSATPLVAMAATTLAVLILVQDWRKADYRGAIRLVLSTLAGIPLGLLFLKSVEESIVNVFLGGILILFAALHLLGLKTWRLRDERASLLFGFVAGVLGGAYNTNGPPVIIYGTLRGWAPEEFRATLQGYFLPTGGAILIGHGLAGLWTAHVVTLYLWSLPAVVAAAFLGSWLHRAISAASFKRWVYLALLALGAALVFKSLTS